MKTFISFLFTALVLVSCSKTNIAGPEQITGGWELRELATGIAGTAKYSAGNGVTLTFNNNRDYEFSMPGFVKRRGSYEINKTARDGDYILSIRYFQNGLLTTENDSIRFSGNQLIFLSEGSCCGVPNTIYNRTGF